MAEPLRLGVDEHVRKAVTRGVRRRGITVVRVQDAGHREDDDDHLLHWAIDNGLVFVTEDHDFEAIHKVDQDHLGIVVIGSMAPIGHMVEWLELIARAVSREEIRGQIIYIPWNP